MDDRTLARVVMKLSDLHTRVGLIGHLCLRIKDAEMVAVELQGIRTEISDLVEQIRPAFEPSTNSRS